MKKTKLEETPTIDDLRDSSFVAQESDIVMMLWRNKERDNTNPVGYRYTNDAVLTVEKNRRTGKLGYVKLSFNNGRFIEIRKM